MFPAWLVELTGNYSRLHENRYGDFRTFFVPQAVVQGALDLVISSPGLSSMVTSWLYGFFVKSPCLALNRKTPAGPGCCSEFFFLCTYK